MSENENIEKFFKSSFDKTPVSEPWNTPSEAVWFNIEKGMKKKPSILFTKQKFITAFTLISMALLSIKTCSLQKDITQLENQLLECSHKNNKSDSSTLDRVTLTTLGKNLTENPDKDLPLKREVDKKITSTIFSGLAQKKKTDNPQPSTELATITMDTLQESPSLTHPYLVAKDSVNQPIHQDIIKHHHQVSLSTKPDTIIVQLVSKEPVIQRNNRHFFGISSGIWSWNLHSSGNHENPLNELITGESIRMSKSFGVIYAREFSNRWEVSAGLQYSERTLRTNYSIQLPYSHSNEMLSQGDYFTEFNHSLPTSWGDVNSTMILARSSQSQISSQEIVPLEYHMENESSIFHIPVQVKYYALQNHKSLHFSGGILNEVIWQSHIKKLTLSSHHNIIKEKNVQANYNDQQIQHLNLYITAGIGYDMNIKNKFKVGISGQYAHPLQPLYRTQTFLQNINGINFALYGLITL